MLPCLVGIGRTSELPNPRKYISTCQNKNGCLPTPQSIYPHSPPSICFQKSYTYFHACKSLLRDPVQIIQIFKSQLLGDVKGAVFIFSFHYIFSLHSIFLRSVGSLQGTIRNENQPKLGEIHVGLRKQPWEYLLNSPAFSTCNFSVRNVHQRM